MGRPPICIHDVYGLSNGCCLSLSISLSSISSLQDFLVNWLQVGLVMQGFLISSTTLSLATSITITITITKHSRTSHQALHGAGRGEEGGFLGRMSCDELNPEIRADPLNSSIIH
jgi:hypothetical protein